MSKADTYDKTRHMTAENVHGKHSRGGKGGVEDDESPHLVEATNRDGVHNHGRVTSKAHMGQTVVEDYGLDRSTMVGRAEAERGPEPEGDCYDLSHSITGARAVQQGDKGRKDRT